LINQNGGSLDCVRDNQCGISLNSDVRNSSRVVEIGNQFIEENVKQSILETSKSKINPPDYSSIFSTSSAFSTQPQPILTSIAKTSRCYDDANLITLASWPSSLPISVSSSTSSDEDSSTQVSSANSSTDSLSLSLDSVSLTGSPINFARQLETFLSTVFINHLELIKNAHLFQDENWIGAVIDIAGQKSLLVKPKDIETLELRESVLELFDTADEEFECQKVIIGLEKGYEDLGKVIHSLLYVGGQIIPPNATCFIPRPNHVLVGLEL